MSVAKLNILQDTFEHEFDISRFKKFTREFFNEPEMLSGNRRTGIWREYADHINSYYEIAKYTDGQGYNLIVLAVELKRDSSVDRARSMQRNFISKVLDENDLEAAIVAFYTEDEPSWRLSFVRLDYSFTDTGLNVEVTPARRYSYLIGENEPNHTAQSQLVDIFSDDKHNPKLDQIEEAFSVEKVTEEFFNQYKDKYLKLKEHLEQDDNFRLETEKLGFKVENFSEQFAKKLMGQLAFLYFLQKKGWLGVKIMPENQMFEMEVFNDLYNEQDEYHKDVLKQTFKPTKDGKMKLSSTELFKLDEHKVELLSDCFVNGKHDVGWGNGDKRFIRGIFDFCANSIEKNFFDDYLEPFFYQALNKKRKNDYFKIFNCRIPFLNGGLFEPLEGYNWKDIKFEIPNELFSNVAEKGREADGILDIFDRFNFTMNEAEPLDKEVAVDPEMLGKIFENLLDVKDRKSKGAFYTPREIVHYMCQESLINYLTNEVDVAYDDIKEFILYGEIIRDADGRADVGYGKEFTIKQSVRDNIIEIDEALKNVKVADPAVGSGAFPLGMLNEIVRARNNITEYIIRKDKEGVFERKFGESFIRKRRSAYKMKWDTIKNSIFAVDIEPSAVDITKLRLWLSVVVEQEIDDENLEPHPLPNLDMNIHVGNSLIDEYEGIELFDKSILLKDDTSKGRKSGEMEEQLKLLFDSDEILEEMFDKQSQYFDETNEDNKKGLKDRIDRLRDELIVYKLGESGKSDALDKYNAIKNDKSKPYFIWELEFARVFKDKGGFDIVIGNPPYIGFHKVPDKKYFKNKYISANGKYDFYVLFIEKGIQLAKNKGYISYICPSYFYKRNYGKNLRSLILKQTCIKMIADFNDSQIFDSATTYTCIFGFEKNDDNDDNKIRVIDKDLRIENYHEVLQNTLTEPTWMLDNSDDMKVVNKIRSKGQYTFGEITKSISQGIVTGNNSVYIINQDFIEQNHINYNFLKSIYKGKNIRDNNLVPSNEYVFYPYEINEKGKNDLISEEFIKETNPALYKYLLGHKELLLEREYFRKSNKQWYELWNSRQKKHFMNRKIVFSEINDKNEFVICEECFYSDSACGAELKDEFVKYEKYIVKYLNSKIICDLYRRISVPKANGFLIYKNAFLKGLPIYFPSNLDIIYNDITGMNMVQFNKWLTNEFKLTEEKEYS